MALYHCTCITVSLYMYHCINVSPTLELIPCAHIMHTTQCACQKSPGSYCTKSTATRKPACHEVCATNKSATHSSALHSSSTSVITRLNACIYNALVQKDNYFIKSVLAVQSGLVARCDMWIKWTVNPQWCQCTQPKPTQLNKPACNQQCQFYLS